MKYMNHLRKLALLSSLALSFTLHADGTLPLPGISKDRPIALVGVAKNNQGLTEAGSIPLEMQVAETSTDNSGYRNYCASNASFHSVDGFVTYGSSEEFDVVGICIPAGAISTSPAGSVERVVVAKDGSRVMLLNGMVTYRNKDEITKFSGNLNLINGAATSILKFELNPMN